MLEALELVEELRLGNVRSIAFIVVREVYIVFVRILPLKGKFFGRKVKFSAPLMNLSQDINS